MSKLITIFGATGLQGGSVIQAIHSDSQLSKEFVIRAVTRNPEKPAAQKLKESGIEVVTANQDDAQTLRAAVKGSHTVFLVTNFNESFSREKEAQQGKNVVDACREASVQHLVFSSLTNVTTSSKGKFTKVYHFDAKADIEKYIHDLGLPATIVMAGSYMQNFFYLMRTEEDGTVSLTLPVGDDARFPLIDVATDYGKFVKPVLKNREIMLGKTVYGAEKYYSPSEICATYSQVLGRSAKFITIPPSEFVKYAQPPQMAEDLTEMLQAFASPGYFAGAELGESQALLEDKLHGLKEFLELNKEKF